MVRNIVDMVENKIGEAYEELQRIFKEEKINGVKISDLKYLYLDLSFFTEDINLKYNSFHLSKDEVKELNKNINTSVDFLFSGITFKIYEKLGVISKDLKIEGYPFNSNERKEESLILEEYFLYHYMKSLSELKEDKRVKVQRDNFLYCLTVFMLNKDKNKEKLIEGLGFSLSKLAADHIDKIKKEIDGIKGKGKTFRKLDDTFKGESKEVKDKKEDSLIKPLTDEDIKKYQSKVKRLESLYVNDKYSDKISFIFDDEEIMKKMSEFSKRTPFEDISLYRGQSNSFWGLSPSIAREKSYMKYEKDMFYEILTLKPNEFSNDKNTYEQLITMQHYELPTRLMDLSRNPLISLYFSCESNFDNDGAFYLFKRKKEDILAFDDTRIKCFAKLVRNHIEDICNGCNEPHSECKKNDDSKKRIIHNHYIVRGIAKNSRIESQSGEFILTGVSEEGQRAVNSLDHMDYKVYIIDKDVKKNLLKTLKSLNIHGATVYPELVKMSEYMKEEYKQRGIEDHEVINKDLILEPEEKGTEVAVKSNDSSNDDELKAELIKSLIGDKKLKEIASVNNEEDFKKAYEKKSFMSLLNKQIEKFPSVKELLNDEVKLQDLKDSVLIEAYNQLKS